MPRGTISGMSLVSRVLRRKQRRRPFEVEFAYRADDVVIASYPKSGSTWLRFILANLFAVGGEVDFLTAQLRVPEISKHAREQGADYENLSSPRFMRTHGDYFAECPRAIYLLRDGRDVMVSYYFHFKKFHAFTGTLLEFLEGGRRPSEWSDHVEGWVFQNPQLERVCVIRYEDLMKDTFGEMKKVVSFGGLKHSDDELRRAVEQSTFDRMKAIEQQKGLGYVAAGNREISFVRKGGSGNWRELFGAAEKRVFQQRYGKALIKAGYESSVQW